MRARKASCPPDEIIATAVSERAALAATQASRRPGGYQSIAPAAFGRPSSAR